MTPHVSGKTRVDLFPVNAEEDAVVLVELKDGEGNVEGTAGTKAVPHANILIDVKQPHLWNGMADPYCYIAVAKLVQGEKVVDEVEVTFGYRSFSVDARDEGGVKGRNNKGLITYDRKLKKDAFYLYKAYWNPEPMVYIAGRRFADRAPEERNVTVYTNCDRVTLLVNGVEFEARAAEHHAVVFANVPLAPGKNTLTGKGGDLEDTIVLNGVEQHNEAYTLPDIAAAMAVGNWLDDIKDDSDSEDIDQPEGFYSIEDSLETLMPNPECHNIMKGWLVQQGSLSMASTLEAMRDMMAPIPSTPCPCIWIPRPGKNGPR